MSRTRAMTKREAATPRRKFSVKSMAAAIGIPASEWAGRCYEIACAVIDAGLIPGGGKVRAVYGHWTGPVDPNAPKFGIRRHLPFQRHGWILLSDGLIVDPTRWVFENAAPYVYVGPSDHYDEGGDGWRAAEFAVRSPPAFDAARAVDVEWPASVRAFVEKLLAPERGWTVEQLFFIANAPYALLGEHARVIYLTIARTPAGQTAVPQDNWNRAEVTAAAETAARRRTK